MATGENSLVVVAEPGTMVENPTLKTVDLTINSESPCTKNKRGWDSPEQLNFMDESLYHSTFTPSATQVKKRMKPGIKETRIKSTVPLSDQVNKVTTLAGSEPKSTTGPVHVSAIHSGPNANIISRPRAGTEPNSTPGGLVPVYTSTPRRELNSVHQQIHTNLQNANIQNCICYDSSLNGQCGLTKR